MKTATPDEERRHFAFEHNGVRIYHCLRWCGQITRIFWYAVDPRGIHEEEGDQSVQFDVREQPGAEDLHPSYQQWDRHEAVIRAALDAGTLIMHKDVPPPPPREHVEHVWADGEVMF